ncbi:MAG: methionine adenosyltransferase [Candidatus Komeilibacteria bacterium CG_4_10_14_0_2_um_filter_37_10]|uniref:methionine adenosyltransferase n=1 Tax=Candidatus Komeilibacteria bacterium CG_4_10_14_0_2_um_filter_37_10 TaxID=1974470 RepID=A0A2M7VD65_9BACT|nr:MAG: methionine adenosyltransferase [Candidatus Komeilibacteria bacterium CG_4_10_14_0_2_um_filter_37_10]
MLMGMPMRLRKGFERSAESVTPGHPDKICDQIADSLVDLAIQRDKYHSHRMAAEVTGGHGRIFITGECKVPGSVASFQSRVGPLVRKVYKEITHDDIDSITLHMAKQSPNIAQGVDPGGAGDQGVMIGFATTETPEMMPLPFMLARKLSSLLYQVAQSGKVHWMHTDGKTEVVMKNNQVETLVIAIQHKKGVTKEEMTHDLYSHVIEPTLGYMPKNFVLNGGGEFHIGGFAADAGTTGRKLVIDNYGPEIPIGGGAYSGKDPTKVDRSAAYMARFIAKNIVAHHVSGAKEALVHLAYAIMKEEPMGLIAITDKGVDVSPWVREHFDLRPKAIIETLNLWRPIYRTVNVGGHYGVDHVAHPGLLHIWTWEAIRTDL